MAATSTISTLGDINNAGSNTALFLKVFAGEVLTNFNTNQIMRPLQTMRTISSGKSA